MRTNEVILQYLKLPAYLVDRLHKKGMRFDKEEAVADGMLALVEVANRWDPSKGAKRFMTIAYPRVMGAILDGVRKRSNFHRRKKWAPEFVSEDALYDVAAMTSDLDAQVDVKYLMRRAPKNIREFMQERFFRGKPFGQITGATASWDSQLYARYLDVLRRLAGRENGHED